MIWCIGLNPAWDITMGLSPARGAEGARRADWTEAVAGGKANNAARVAASLGEAVTAVGLYGGATGRLVQQSLCSQGIRVVSAPAEGDTRVCLTLLDGGVRREIRGQGPPVDAARAEELLQQVWRSVAPGDVVAMAGSLPPGLPPGLVGDWIRSLSQRAGLVAADVSGDALAAAWAASPDLLTPNSAEYREMRRRGPGGEGPKWLAVTRGARGAGVRAPGGRWRRLDAEAARVVVNATGAGDALLGGTLAAAVHGLPMLEALAFGVRVASATLGTRGVAVLPPDRASALAKLLPLPSR
jgi:1-phosphofructokinase family hexose kinase